MKLTETKLRNIIRSVIEKLNESRLVTDKTFDENNHPSLDKLIKSWIGEKVNVTGVTMKNGMIKTVQGILIRAPKGAELLFVKITSKRAKSYNEEVACEANWRQVGSSSSEKVGVTIGTRSESGRLSSFRRMGMH